MTIKKNTAIQTGYKAPDETRNVAVDMSGKLSDSETLSGTPTVSGDPSGLTISSIAVSSGELEINDVAVDAGQAVTFKVAGGTAGQSYTLTLTVATSAGQTLVEYLSLVVDDE